MCSHAALGTVVGGLLRAAARDETRSRAASARGTPSRSTETNVAAFPYASAPDYRWHTGVRDRRSEWLGTPALMPVGDEPFYRAVPPRRPRRRSGRRRDGCDGWYAPRKSPIRR